MTTPQTTTAIAYLRVSTDKQADHGMSLEAQRRKVEAYAELYGLTIIAFEVDAGESAKTLKRPALQRALGAIKEGRAESLVTTKLDRLTRSVRDLGRLVDTVFKEKGGAHLLVVDEQVDTRTATGRMMANLMTVFSQWEREKTGERTKAVMQYKASKGEYTGGHAPFGYALADDGTLRSVAWEQKAIATARTLRGEGLSLRAIGRKLVELGYKTRKGTAWNPNQVKKLLSLRLIESAA